MRVWKYDPEGGIGDAQRARDAPARIDSDERRTRDARFGAQLVTDAAGPEDEPVEEQRDDGRDEARRHAQPDVGQHVAERSDARIDLARDEQLLGGAAAQIERLLAVGVRGGLEERGRGLPSAAGVRERLREPNAHRLTLRFVGGEIERTPVEERGAIVGERLECLVRSLPCVRDRPRGEPRFEEVCRHRVGIVIRLGFERIGEARVARAARAFAEPRGHRLAHAIVVRLDRVGAARRIGARQVRRTKRGRVLRERGEIQARGAHRGVRRERHAGDRQDLEELALRRIEPRDTSRERVVEVGARWRSSSEVARVANELVDEEGVPLRFGGNRGGDAVVDLAMRREEQARELERLLLGQPPERNRTHFARQPERRAAGPRHGPRRREQEQAWRKRRAEHLGEEREPVEIRPVQVVNRDHDLVALAELREELAYGREEARAALLHVRLRAPLPRGFVDGRDLAQHGEDLREQPRGPWEERRDGRLVEDRELAAESVHDTIERLVRDDLTLVAAAGQDEHALLVGELRDELPDERALADARLPFDDDRDRLAVAHLRVRLVQRRNLSATPEERAARGRRDRSARRARARRGRLQPANDVGAARTSRRIAVQELDGERVEVAGDAVRLEPRGRGVLRHLPLQHERLRALERAPAREALIEDDAHAVPVRGRAHVVGRGLLGGHVRHGADQRGLELRHRRVEHDAEVEQHDAPVARDEDVRRLDVAVDLAGEVHGVNRLRELKECCAQARLVECARALLCARRFLGRRARVLAGRARARDLVCPRAVGLAADMREQVHPVDELHREEPGVPIAHEVAEAHEVRVADVLERAKFVLQAQQRLGFEAPAAS